MLEGATACLKAGARDSLKRVQQAPRSKRLLHQAFWQHGAGDLDLPPWPGSKLPLQHDNTSTRRVDRETSTSSVLAALDGAFLDFLYPPQALAWLHRANAQHWERWERRSARRLPEGFVQATRDYSSKSRAHSAPSRPIDDEKDQSDGSHDLLKDIECHEPKNNNETITSTELSYGHCQTMTNELGAAPRAMAQNALHADSRTKESEMHEYAETTFADSPGDLAELFAEEPLQDPIDALRGLLSGKRVPRGEDKVDRAWTLYNLLHEDRRQDARLKNAMMLWLLKQDNPVADAHSVDLYWSLSLADRSLPTYQTALAAFLRRNDHESALDLHKEALYNIPNGHQITRELFRHALEKELWKLALDAQTQHHETFSAVVQAHRRKIFWLNVAEIPALPHIAARFISKLQHWKSKGKQDLARYLTLCARLTEEALKQIIPVPCDGENGIATMRLEDAGSLFDCIREWSSDASYASRMLEEILFTLLQHNGPRPYYARVHRIVSRVYYNYRAMAEFQPPESLLMILLKRVVRQAREFRPREESHNNLTVQILITDWERHHGKLTSSAVVKLMAFQAGQGNSEEVQKWFGYLKQNYPTYEEQRSALIYTIYVHARRADLPSAVEAFHDAERLAQANNDQLDITCWNALLHAYSRADDLQGALAAFRYMVEHVKLIPNNRSFHPISEMLASRGDVEGVENLLEQFDRLSGARRSIYLINSHLKALVNIGEVQKAEALLKQAVPQVQAEEVLGSLTECFNILIVAYAMRRDVNATMRIYRTMKAEAVQMDASTYSALMQALIHYRQTPAAEKVMTTVMRREGFKPQALHYAILMAGYTNQRMYEHALRIYERLLRNNVKPTLAIKRVYFKAKALHEQATKQPTTVQGEPAPLEDVLAELRQAFAQVDGSELAAKQPAFGYDLSERGTTVSSLVTSVMFIHGSRRCLQAVEEMFKQYKSKTLEAGHSSDPPPMRMLTALMNCLFHAKDYTQLEAYWKIAKREADLMAPLVAVPVFRSADETSETAPEHQTLPEPLDMPPSPDDADRGEIGFTVSDKSIDQGTQTLLPRSSDSLGPRPAPARRHILTRPLRYYLRALAVQGRIGDAVTTCTKLLSQGYTFDIITWNRFIEHLCTSSPPLVLLAFTLTERFLIPNFPGWTSANSFIPQLAAREQGLQHIRARYLRRDQVMPQYRTMVHLAAALLWMRNTEATRGQQMGRDQKGLRRLVGTVKQVGQSAPRTLAAVRTMPRVDDELQHKFLRSH